MSYSARISTANPHAIVILVDQSGSMSETIAWRGNTTTKAEALSEVINSTLAELVARCNHYGDYRHFFDIAVLGYSGAGVYSLLGDNHAFVTPSNLAFASVDETDVTNVREMPDGTQVVTHYRHKVWVRPHCEGETPMGAALMRAFDMLAAWILSREDKMCFPPLVINITDGEATDASQKKLIDIAQKIKRLKTQDGATLLMNIHISANSRAELLFPEADECPVDDSVARTLFEMSSVMPQIFEREIMMITDDKPPYRGFAYNASLADVMRMLNLGSSTAPITM